MKAILAKISIVAGSVVLMLVALEIGLHFFGPPPASAPLIPDPVLDHVHMQDFTFKAYNPDGQFEPFIVYWDSRGLAADPEKRLVKDPSKSNTEIALMGDSFVEASQAPYAKSFAGLLNSRASKGVFFTNWGVSSYSPIIYELLWRRKVQSSHPSHVFLLLYENDVNDDKVYASKAEFSPDGFPEKISGVPEHPALAWLRRSALFRRIRFAFIKIQAGIKANHDSTVSNAGEYQEVSPEIFPLTARMILGLKKEVESTGSKFTILAVPSRRADILGDPSDGPPSFASRVSAFCTENRISYLDLERPFLNARQKHGPRKLFFDKDIHFTPAGHAVVAAAIMSKYPEYFSEEPR